VLTELSTTLSRMAEITTPTRNEKLNRRKFDRSEINRLLGREDDGH
jgi:hypothetical protein